QAISQLPITRIIIAHRESTIESADRVIKLDNPAV
ncbi:MAG TPA: secretion ATPase, partial [Morganella sp. (in: Bacteria)]|nr:secretion ATPase [Morganella sp. (in: enterobacteria)]